MRIKNFQNKKDFNLGGKLWGCMRQERGRPKEKNKLLNLPYCCWEDEEHHSEFLCSIRIPLFHSSFVGFLVDSFSNPKHMLSSSSFFFFFLLLICDLFFSIFSKSFWLTPLLILLLHDHDHHFHGLVYLLLLTLLFGWGWMAMAMAFNSVQFHMVGLFTIPPSPPPPPPPPPQSPPSTRAKY